jgi:arylsulfatase A-like enzyme
MKILYVDIDSLRPDHLGCYGYHRNTSPTIDGLAAAGIRFDNIYASDAPCLPSRTALFSGRTGFHTGVVGHGGTTAQPYIEGPSRGFHDLFGVSGWMNALRQAGHYTAAISSFGERHSAWHWYAGFNEIINPGYHGMERADQVVPLATDWLDRNGAKEHWFLHVNLWDPHTPYRTPAEFGNPFGNEPLPAWLTEEVFEQCCGGYGPHSPQEPYGFDDSNWGGAFPLAPVPIGSMADVRSWIDGYDMGVRYADIWIERLLSALDRRGLLNDTMIVIGADHGENLAELNIWGDHQTADQFTCRVPLIFRMPNSHTGSRVDGALHYHFDWAATLIEMVGGTVPWNWDGRSFATSLEAGEDAGREFLVMSQGAWACQRGIRFDHEERSYICLVTYHDGLKDFPPFMLFDLTSDPHETHDLAAERPDLVEKASLLLTQWLQEMMSCHPGSTDPLMTVMREGGPYHARGELPRYLERLRRTGREHHARSLEMRHRSGS